MAEDTTQAIAVAPVQSAEPPAPRASAAPDAETARSDALVETELLVEDVSIDGMCGVY
jgi:mycofactocin precursor